jgi:CHAD domain-containing protein
MSIAASRMDAHSTMSDGHPDMRAISTASPSRRPSRPGTAAPGDPTPLAQSLARRVEALARHLQAALDGDGHAIHQARVATRRLREILPIVIDTQSGRGQRLRRRLKRLTAALGPVRELDVAITLVQSRAEGEAAAAVVALQAHLTERRRTAFEHLREACDPGRARRLLSRLADLVRDRETSSRRGHGDLPSRERRRLARGVIDRARELGIAVGESGAILIVERVHAVRIAAKRLRYALELAGELRLARTASLVSSLRAVQDVLGNLHDLDVLRGEAGRVRTALPPDSTLAGDLEQLSDRIDADIRLLHARYLRGARALAALTDRVRDRIAPCLDPSIST